MAFIFSIGLTACVNPEPPTDEKSAYELYKEKYGYVGSEEDWLYDIENGYIGAPVKHTVTFDYQDGGPCTEQEVGHRQKVTRPETPQKGLGYLFAGWVYNNGEESVYWNFANDIVISDITLVAHWEYATKELPIVNISTSGEINSKVDYTDMTFSIENCDGELTDVTGGIRLRGNTTMGYVKKPYRIKFDKKQSLFGLTKAKSWVLLADYLDPSSMYNYSAMSLGAQMPGLAFTTTPNKVNVYLNGEFLGIYTMCEQIQENEGRMNIEMEEITEDMTNLTDFNFFISLDGKSKNDPDAVENETYFLVDNGRESEDLWWCFELKYPEKDDFCSEQQFRSFFNQLVSYVENLLIDFTNKDVQAILSNVNVGSLVDYLIVDQLMGERDHANYSFNMYYTNTNSTAENGKLSFGPIWDYDRCLLVKNFEGPNQTYFSYYSINKVFESRNPFYAPFYKTPELLSIVKERYNAYGVPAITKYMAEIDAVAESMKESNELNRKKWYSDLDPQIVEKNVAFLKSFFVDRKRILDRDWALDK